MRPVQPGYINCLRLMFETCPAGGAGTRVSAELSLGLLLKPLKKVEQYERFPPGIARGGAKTRVVGFLPDDCSHRSWTSASASQGWPRRSSGERCMREQ